MISETAKKNYHSITEIPGLKASKEQLARLYHRYHFALSYAGDKDVIEVACGSGIGLGYLASAAKHVIGIDIDEKNLSIASQLYKGRENIDVVSMDAHELRYPDHTFDLVLLYEALYYLQEPARFIAEAARVLKKGGTLIIGTVNKDWADFHPSPFTQQYFSVPELFQIINSRFEIIHIYGAFPTQLATSFDLVLSLLKRAAVHLKLIPGSLEARAYLKWILGAHLLKLPEQICAGMTSFETAVELPIDRPSSDYKIIYAVAMR